jgi:hypothetical protein
MPRGDLALALLLAAGAAASRVPFRARRLPTWDAVQFALSLREYDIVKHQPHPPGYILYVAAGRAVEALVGDPTQALAWLSIGATGATVFLVYRLAWILDGRSAALVAALSLAASPLFWFYGEVGLPYVIESALATAVATLVWPMRGGDARFVPWSALALGLAGGVRQSLLFLLFPLWLGTAWAGLRRRGPVLAGCAVVALTSAAWLLPMVSLAGGPGRYVAAGRELFDSTVRMTTLMDPSGGWRGNVRGLVEALALGMGLLLPLLAWFTARGLSGIHRWGAGEWFFAAWIVPPLAVYVSVHFGQYGYLLTVLPALYILVARSIVAAIAVSTGPGQARAVRRALGWTGLAAILLAHVAFFVGAGPIEASGPAAPASVLERGIAELRTLYRFRLWAHTARGLGEQEGVIGAYVESIRGEFDPADTALVTELGNPRSYPWFRHATYYLPDFAVYHLRLGPWSAGYLFSRQLDTMAAISDREIRLPPGVGRLVWMVDYWNPALPRPPGLRERSLPYGRWLYVLEVHGASVEHAGYRLTLPGAAAPIRERPVPGLAWSAPPSVALRAPERAAARPSPPAHAGALPGPR